MVPSAAVAVIESCGRVMRRDGGVGWYRVVGYRVYKKVGEERVRCCCCCCC